MCRYAHMAAAKDKKKLKKLKQRMHFLSSQGMGKHTVFVDSTEEVEDFDAAEYFDTPEELTGR